MKTRWLSKYLKRLRRGRRPARDHRAPPVADPETLKRMVRGIITTRPDEIGCDECFEQVDRFAEMMLDGKDAAEALPLVQEHLERCDNCREEFEALLVALRALT
jgi:hypothetical protein